MKTIMIVFKYLKNKYVIAFVVFILWITVIDKNNIFTGIKVDKSLKEVEKVKKNYLEETKNDSITIDQLRKSPSFLEKFAREEYGMKKDDEDVFVIVKK
jgi:cell division protein DivIC